MKHLYSVSDKCNNISIGQSEDIDCFYNPADILFQNDKEQHGEPQTIHMYYPSSYGGCY